MHKIEDREHYHYVDQNMVWVIQICLECHTLSEVPKHLHIRIKDETSQMEHRFCSTILSHESTMQSMRHAGVDVEVLGSVM